MSPLMASREFTDSQGVAWNVWSVTPSEMSSTLTRLAGLVDERRVPWLVFQSAEGEKRRLVPIPGDWLDCDDFTLERWAMRAERVPPAPARRSKDNGNPPA
jgi:hypothetical protein